MKKIVSMIIALCVILSVCLIPTVITTTAEESTPLDDTIDNVIKAEVKFTNGDEGVNKEVRTALYSISFSYAPARLGFLGLDYNFGSSTTQGNAPIRSREWSIAYDYLLEDEVVGLGGMFTSQPYDWYVATNAGEDLTAGVGTWQNAKISLDSLMATDVYSKPLYALAFVVKTTAAVDTSKTYNVYYKNIRVVDKSGNTIYTFFDNSVTTQELNPQVWDVQTNASMTISVVDDPNPTPVGGGEGEGGEGGEGEGAGGTTPPPQMIIPLRIPSRLPLSLPMAPQVPKSTHLLLFTAGMPLYLIVISSAMVTSLSGSML